MRRLLSIVRLTLANAIRMKVAIVIIVFLAIVIPSLPFVLQTDDTQKGHVQITLTYGIGMVFFLLAIMTVFIGAASISNEKTGQLQLLDTKPVTRWQIILGKWLGIMTLNVVLIIFLGGITYGLTRFIGRASAGTDKEQTEIRNSVFTARVSVKPLPPEGIEDKVNREFETRKKENRIPDTWKVNDEEGNFRAYKEQEYKQHLAELELKRHDIVPPGAERLWKFEGINIDRENMDGVIYLRFKAGTTGARSDKMLAGRWLFGGTYDPGEGREPIEKWGTLDVMETVNSPHEIEVPSFVVKPDGTIEIIFLNLTASDDGRSGLNVVFDPVEGVELLYERTGFLSNYIRYFLLVLTMLGFLAMLSVASSSFMSFPVTALLVFSILLNAYGLSTFRDFVESTNPAEIETTGQRVGIGAAKIVYFVVSHIIPDFGKYSMLSHLNSGRYIDWRLVLHGAVVLIILYGGIIYAGGCLIFYREELG